MYYNLKVTRQFGIGFVALLFVLSTTPVYGQHKEENVLNYSMQTRWSDKASSQNPWPQYPRPQMTRENWVNLNGNWEYAILDKKEGKPDEYDGDILVPYPVESSLSGVKQLVGAQKYLWYKRTFTTPQMQPEERLLLHFGAVDWETVIYVNGQEVGMHKGGYDPFTFDITEYLRKEGKQEIVIRVWDPTDEGMQARGKQVSRPKGIWYSPVTGIWQTVWLEAVPADYIKHIKITPNIDQRIATISMQLSPLSFSGSVMITASANGKKISEAEILAAEGSKQVLARLDIPDPMLWSPKRPFLYDLQITLKDQAGKVVDQVGSYFGMRKIALGKGPNGYTRIMLNNKPVFQFGLLDQGWWPDGLYTAPTEEAMVYDIKVTKDMGFNMLRKHVKVEPARFYYHCDKMGMLVWQDMPSGFMTAERSQQHVKHDALVDWERPKESAVQFEHELKAMIDHLYSFPSIVVWVPLNEGWGQYDTKRLTRWVETYDTTRLVDSPSGWADRKVGDIIDVHLYPGPGMELPEEDRASVLGEFGGLGLPVKGHLWWQKRNWGYLTYPDKETYINEFKNLIQNLKGLISWGLSAAIYTQTTDVEGEVNGLMTYDREVIKINPELVKELIAPLYQPWWEKWILVGDSEHDPQDWQVAFEQPQDGWVGLMFDDFKWATRAAPFSATDNFFLPAETKWTTKNLYARKTFHLNGIPENIYLKYYATNTNVKVYLNGKLIKTLTDKGGRKRHYTHVLFNEGLKYLRPGKNVLAVEVHSEARNGSFDIGMYATRPIAKGKNQQPDQ